MHARARAEHARGAPARSGCGGQAGGGESRGGGRMMRGVYGVTCCHAASRRPPPIARLLSTLQAHRTAAAAPTAAAHGSEQAGTAADVATRAWVLTSGHARPAHALGGAPHPGRAGTCDPLPLPLLKHTLAHTCTKSPPKTHTKHTLAQRHHHLRGLGAPTHLENLPAVRPQPQHQLPHALVAHVDRGDHGVDLRMRRGAQGGVPGCAQALPGVGCTGVVHRACVVGARSCGEPCTIPGRCAGHHAGRVDAAGWMQLGVGGAGCG